MKESIVEVRYCPVYPLKLRGFDDKLIHSIETQIQEVSCNMEECRIVWLNGRYTRIPADAQFLSPKNEPSRTQSYNRDSSPPDVHYGENIVDLVYRLKLKITTPDIRPLHLALKSGPVYLYIVELTD